MPGIDLDQPVQGLALGATVHGAVSPCLPSFACAGTSPVLEEATDGTWSVEEATREVISIEGKSGDIGDFTRHLTPLIDGS